MYSINILELFGTSHEYAQYYITPPQPESTHLSHVVFLPWKYCELVKVKIVKPINKVRKYRLGGLQWTIYNTCMRHALRVGLHLGLGPRNF